MLGVVVEVQLWRNSLKRRRWPSYVANLHDRLGAPVALLVICVDERVAKWCAQPIDFGPGWRGVPLVLGPDRVPVLTEIDQAAGVPELAVLSALAHGGGPESHKVIDVLAEVLSFADVALGVSYAGLVLASLPEAARDYMEALMKSETFPYQGEYARELLTRGWAEGRTEGRAEATVAGILSVLDARGLDVADDARSRVVECSDVDQLDRWLRRAATVDSVEELFA